MPRHSFTLLPDATLLRELDHTAVQGRETTAMLLAQIAEVDERRAYLQRAFPSMHAYCVGHLHFSEESAWKRIQAARAVRAVPELLDAVADGRLHVSAVVAIAPHLTRENAAERIAAATHQSMAQVRELVNDWTGVGPAEGQNVMELSPELDSNPVTPEDSSGRPISGTGVMSGSGSGPALAPCARRAVTHLFDQEALELLEQLRDLLAHQVPSGDPVEVLKVCMREKLTKIQKRRCGAAAKPGAHHVAATARTIPSAVRREVWERDGGRCTFESDRGHRCESRRFVEFDHIVPIARGGKSVAENLRLRCRAHNQYEARRVFGEGFMNNKQRAARERAAERGSERAAIETLLHPLEQLGLRGAEAREAATVGAALKDATIEQRMRAVLQWLGKRHARRLTTTSG